LSLASVICFSTSDGSKGLNYPLLYREIETIVEVFPAWTVKDIKSLTVRERKHWFKRSEAKVRSV